MEQPAASEIAQHGDQIEITEPGRIDFGKRFQVESSGVESIQVLDNRIRVYVFHTDYKVVKRCGKPATEQPRNVSRPSNAELAARAAATTEAASQSQSAANMFKPAAAIVTKAELAALEKAIDVPVVRKADKAPDRQDGKTAAQATPKLSIDESKVTVQSNDTSPEATAALGYGSWHATRIEKEASTFELTQEQFDEMTRQEITSTSGLTLTAEHIASIVSAVEQGPFVADNLTIDGVTFVGTITSNHIAPTAQPAKASPHSHYFKPCPFPHVDVYRVLSLFNVTDPCLQHAVKKLLVADGRGHKDIAKDVQDSIDTLERWKAMRQEEAA